MMKIEIFKLIENLSQIVKRNLSDLFFGRGVYHGENIAQVCKDSLKVCTAISDGIVNLSDEPCGLFLKSTLPILCEVFLRRKTNKEHEQVVVIFLDAVIKLICRSSLCGILELCLLRNVILSGGTSFTFFTMQDIVTGSQNHSNSILGGGFFSDHGKVGMVYKSGKCVYYWPDEWEKELGGEKCVGHFLSIYEGNGLWRNGQVIDYRPSSGKHIIRFDPISSSEESSTNRVNNSYGKTIGRAGSRDVDSADESVEKIDLKTVLLEWSDSSHVNNRTSGYDSRQLDTHGKLLFNTSDKGKFVRVWWSRYHRFYYARVTAFDVRTRHHNLCYEDSDNRAYDMSTKEYELIVVPEGISISNCKSDAEAAQLISQWHQKHLLTASTATANSINTTQPSSDDGAMNSTVTSDTASNEYVIAPRPSAISGYGVSIHLLHLLNLFYNEGGFETMFYALTNPSISPPSAIGILSHLRLLYLVRPRILPNIFKGLVWDMKEAVPNALLRYDDTQFKSLTKVELTDIAHMLKELVVATESPESEFSLMELNQGIETLNLHVYSRLLRCSQLQRRYLGLSMIKEAIELCMPTVVNYVQHKPNGGVSRPSTATGVPAPIVGRRSSNLTPTQIGDWLVEGKVLEAVFGESLHQDLASRSDMLLVFMAIRR